MSSLAQNITFGLPSQDKKRPISSGRVGSSSLYHKQEQCKANCGFPFMKKKNSISSSKQHKKVITNQKGQLTSKKSKIIEGMLIDKSPSMAHSSHKEKNSINHNSATVSTTPNNHLHHVPIDSKNQTMNNSSNIYKYSNSSSYKSRSNLLAKQNANKKAQSQMSPNMTKKNMNMNPFARLPPRSYSPLFQSSNITFNNGHSKPKSMGDTNHLNSSFKNKNNSKLLSLPFPSLNQKHQRAITPILRSKFILKNIAYNNQGKKIPKPNRAMNNSKVNSNNKGIYCSPFTNKNNIHQSKVMGYYSPYQMNRMNSTMSKSKNIFKNFKGANHNYFLKDKTTIITMNINQDNNDQNTNTNTPVNKNDNQLSINNNDNILPESNETQSQRPIDPFQKNKGIIEELKKKKSTVNSQPNLLLKSKLNAECKKVIKRMHEFSKTGYAGDDEKKVNQDNYFVFRNFVNSSQNIFMSVCDGHGAVGQEISGFLKENLPIDLNKEIRASKKDISKDSLDDIITKIFLNTNDNLSNNEMINSMLSGSTCVSLIYTPSKVITANVGDSRAIVGKLSQTTNQWSCLELTRDHKPSDTDESKRILSQEGRIEPMRDDDGSFIGPPRVWLKDKEYPGLAMSRSFGDRVAHSVGVCAVPEIKEYKFESEDMFFILASDGLYEFITNQEIVDIVKDFYIKDDIVKCCEHLYELSAERWMKEEQSIDDITMIVVFLEEGEI